MSCWCEFSMFGISHFLEVEFADFTVFEPLCWKFTIQISSHNRDQLEVGIRLVLDIRDCRLILGGKVNSTFVKCLAELNEFLLDLSSVHSISTDLTVDCVQIVLLMVDFSIWWFCSLWLASQSWHFPFIRCCCSILKQNLSPSWVSFTHYWCGRLDLTAGLPHNASFWEVIFWTVVTTFVLLSCAPSSWWCLEHIHQIESILLIMRCCVVLVAVLLLLLRIHFTLLLRCWCFYCCFYCCFFCWSRFCFDLLAFMSLHCCALLQRCSWVALLLHFALLLVPFLQW